MMFNRINRSRLLFAGFVLIASLIFIMKGGVAETNVIPKPQIKPSFDIGAEALNKKQLQVKGVLGATSDQLKSTKPAGIIANNKKLVLTSTGELQVIENAAEAIPKPLSSDRQARLIGEIFDLQQKGDMSAADNKIAQLNSTLLLGHIYAQRYLHPTAYKSNHSELADWLQKYSDHPQAAKIHKLAKNKKSSGKPLKAPQTKKIISGNLNGIARSGKRYRSTKRRSDTQNARVDKLVTEIRQNVKQEKPTLALSVLSNDYAVQFMDDVEYDRFLALIASGYLYAGKTDDAARLAQQSIDRSGYAAPLAGWVGGLAHWQQKNYSKSAQFFEKSAESKYSSGWLVSASAYWASRAHRRLGNNQQVNKWLEKSSTYPRTFYGLIATRALGNDTHFNWKVPSLGRDQIKLIEGTSQGKRASALIQVGQIGLAEEELKYFDLQSSVKRQQALLAYANHHNLSSLLMRLGNAFSNPKGGLYDAALYPLAGFTPKGGYRVNKALLHAFIRQESRFNRMAYNPSGATGLMQIMPSTATHVSGDQLYSNSNGHYYLSKPEVNLSIGQKYIQELLGYKSVNQDLMSLAIAYNAGPGNLSKWKSKRKKIKDPLLFIETIPYNETRAFVERVVSNYWIYQMRLNQKTPSLDAVVKGEWARYAGRNDFATLANR